MNRLDSIVTTVLKKGLTRDTFHTLIISLPLDEACVAFGLIHTHSSHTINGHAYSLLAKRLVQAEVRPGGPYYNKSNQPDINTNIGAAFLFKSMGKELPALTTFLAAQNLDVSIDISPSLQARVIATIAAQDRIAHFPPILHDRIIASSTKILNTFDPPVKRMGKTLLKRILDADKANEITLLSDAYNRSIPTPVSDNRVIQLGTANLFCWMAYTIYDDIQDDAHNTQLVSLANILQRQSLSLYQNTADKASRLYIQQTFNTMDSANIWELSHCRVDHQTALSLPTYTNAKLTNRSLGHILGPLLIEATTNTKKNMILLKGLTHYLSAKQLNDDIHDWKSDAAKGHLSFVVCALLQKISPRPTQLQLSHNTIKAMEEVFWHSEAVQLSKRVLQHTKKARRYYQDIGISDHTPFTFHIATIENNTKRAIAQRQHYQQFLDSYHHSK